ncbi:TPA: hypothetical protein N0F65_006044 [Lagenidium giganteum]|uniref:Uncharacterized protein n=1 Tax=Lagenidium giganteum TaxID=4803 RepID=A0AAV2Z6E0_9STRA|nr:TPA: hypothetical protein N0F65_006044 [Lagenidium giganteum]
MANGVTKVSAAMRPEMKGFNISVCVASSAPPNGNHNALIIGISCGIIVAVMLLLFVWIRHRQKKQQQLAATTTTNTTFKMDNFCRGLY